MLEKKTLKYKNIVTLIVYPSFVFFLYIFLFEIWQRIMSFEYENLSLMKTFCMPLKHDKGNARKFYYSVPCHFDNVSSFKSPQSIIENFFSKLVKLWFQVKDLLSFIPSLHTHLLSFMPNRITNSIRHHAPIRKISFNF